MNETASLITLFDPTPIYASGSQLAKVVYFTASPVLLVIAIFIRSMETQLDVAAGHGRWTVAIRDFIGWGLVLTIYFGLANLVAEFMNALFAWIDTFGTLQAIGNHLAALSQGLKDKAAAQGTSRLVLEFVLSAGTALPSMLVSFACYYLSLLIVTALCIFMKVAHALGYSIGVAYGLIAIPLAITRSLRLLRGWAVFMGFLLLWPVVQGFAIGLFTPLFAKASASLIANPDVGVAAATFGTYMFFTVLHLIVAAILIAAPFVAGALAANTSAHAGLVTPFATAAVAAGAMMFRSRMSLSGLGGSAGSAKSQSKSATDLSPAGADPPKPRVAAPSMATQAPSASSALSGQAASAEEAIPAAASPPIASAEAAGRARQQRRGVIITQNKKARTS